MFTRGIALAALAAHGLAAAAQEASVATRNLGIALLPTRRGHHYGHTRYGLGGQHRRSCYWPHQGKHECERRVRQAARNYERQAQRGTPEGIIDGCIAPAVLVSRRGRVMPCPATA